MSDLIAAIAARRSTGKVLPDPIPREAVEELLGAAVRAPNHHITEPWRFVVMTGDARRALGAAHAAAVAREKPDLPAAGLEKEAARPQRAPVLIAAIVRPTGSDPVTVREDRDAVVAACQNLLLAAHALGLGAMWRTGAMVDEPEVREHLGLIGDDAIVGFVYLGRPAQDPGPPSPRQGVDAVSEWRGWEDPTG